MRKLILTFCCITALGSTVAFGQETNPTGGVPEAEEIENFTADLCGRNVAQNGKVKIVCFGYSKPELTFWDRVKIDDAVFKFEDYIADDDEKWVEFQLGDEVGSIVVANSYDDKKNIVFESIKGQEGIAFFSSKLFKHENAVDHVEALEGLYKGNDGKCSVEITKGDKAYSLVVTENGAVTLDESYAIDELLIGYNQFFNETLPNPFRSISVKTVSTSEPGGLGGITTSSNLRIEFHGAKASETSRVLGVGFQKTRSEFFASAEVTQNANCFGLASVP